MDRKMGWEFNRGKVYIFNILTLQNESEKERQGSGKDVANLKSAFENINAEVVTPFIDLNKDEIVSVMQKVQKEDFTKYDYVAIAFFSHGLDDSVACTVEWERIYLLRTFMIPLFKNKTLSKKLKWLITQTCRGRLISEGSATESEGTDLPFYDPKYYLISYSTTEGHLSLRNSIYGSLFIQSLSEELSALKEHRDEDIISTLERVSQRTTNKARELNLSQVPSHEENFNGIFSFSFYNETKWVKKEDQVKTHVTRKRLNIN